MDILDNYLDTMFSHYPLTPRTLEAKRELRAMMEDAYNGALAAGRSQNEAIGQAIAEFGNLDEVAPLLGLTQPPSQFGQDPYSGGAQYEGTNQQSPQPAYAEASAASGREYPGAEPPRAAFTPRPSPMPTVTMAQAKNYADTMRRTRWLLGAGVAIIVLGAMPLIALTTASQSPYFPLSENIGTAIGFVVLLPMVALGVGLLVWRGQQLSPFRAIIDHKAVVPPPVQQWAESLRATNASSHAVALVTAIAVWVLSALPIMVAGIYTDPMTQDQADPLIGAGLAATMTLVAVGLLVYLPAAWARSASSVLIAGSPEALAQTQDEGEWGENRYPAGIRAIFAGYWPIMVAIYLAWSFIGDAWGTSWIIWPVAGVTYGAFAAIASAIYPPVRTGR